MTVERVTRYVYREKIPKAFQEEGKGYVSPRKSSTAGRKRRRGRRDLNGHSFWVGMGGEERGGDYGRRGSQIGGDSPWREAVGRGDGSTGCISWFSM